MLVYIARTRLCGCGCGCGWAVMCSRHIVVVRGPWSVVRIPYSYRIDVLGAVAGALNPSLTCCLGMACKGKGKGGGWRRSFEACARGVKRGNPRLLVVVRLWQVSFRRAEQSFCLTWPTPASVRFCLLQSRVTLPGKTPCPPTLSSPHPLPRGQDIFRLLLLHLLCAAVFVWRPSASSIYKFERILFSAPTLPLCPLSSVPVQPLPLPLLPSPAAASPKARCPCQIVKFTQRCVCGQGGLMLLCLVFFLYFMKLSPEFD